MWCTLRSTTVWCLAAASVLVGSLVAEAKDAEYNTDSREYKLLLVSWRFYPDTPSAIETLWHDHLKALIDDALGMKDNIKHRYSRDFDVNQPRRRMIRFWDTVRPYQCALKNNGYNLRERVDLVDGRENDAGREVTLKLRDEDPARVANTDMESSGDHAKSTFEEDVVPVKGGNDELGYKVMFSSSVSQKLNGHSTLSTLRDIFDMYPKLDAHLKEDGAFLGPNESIGVVSGLSLLEEVYDGPSIDLGNVSADLSISVWYRRVEGPLTAPLIAELSFKLEKKGKEVNPNVLKRADALFSKLRTLTWISPDSETKTNFVYDYARFCQ